MTYPRHSHHHPQAPRLPARIGSWMPLSPQRIRTHQFRDTPIGRRGYRPDEVDAFVDRLAADIQQWSHVYAGATAEVHRLRNYFRSQGLDPDNVRQHALSAEAITVLATAQQHADQLIADAQAHARTMQDDARTQAEELITGARRNIDTAAQAYRARAGKDYTADREQVERLAALSRNILAALTGATTQMDGARLQLSAIADAFTAELTKLTERTATSAPPYPVTQP